MRKLVALFIIALFFFPGNCASPATRNQSPPARSITAETRSRVEKELAEEIKVEEETFNLRSLKMDEYQDLLVICERISESGDDSTVRTTCKERLAALKKELEELSEMLQRQH